MCFRIRFAVRACFLAFLLFWGERGWRHRNKEEEPGTGRGQERRGRGIRGGYEQKEYSLYVVGVVGGVTVDVIRQRADLPLLHGLKKRGQSKPKVREGVRKE